ncbi:DUF2663 family protein [Paenibacillus flagellatus]|uniref:DUF2663 domain-containing protein n=1 Tax=Paenibacillus flagellatus TaxID=2211139 RepID=A0A2V5KG29_9BACL|nr:DUF2663 family protein [Paenibacillus flagellatus]PYI57544.1 hypothetical protein DLM86_03705 [Paenibacillus flagellatus]
MDETIQWIDRMAVAEDTKRMLKELIARKEKERYYKARLVYVTIVNACVTATIALWLFKLQSDAGGNMMDVLDYFAQSKASVLFVLVGISTFIYAGSLSKQHKKQKDKYENLREEVTRRLSATWKINDDSKLKDALAEKLKSAKDINIRYIK